MQVRRHIPNLNRHWHAISLLACKTHVNEFRAHSSLAVRRNRREPRICSCRGTACCARRTYLATCTNSPRTSGRLWFSI
jgi:hypothetical protein